MSQKESKVVEEIIKSILISSKRPMSGRQINKDYLQIEGVPIPYRVFGYSTVDEYLSSLKGIIGFSSLYSHGEIVYNVKPDESNIHIFKFVRQQKSSKTVGSFKRVDPPSKKGRNRCTRSVSCKPSIQTHPQPVYEHVPPSDIQNSIITILKEQKQEIEFTKFCRLYREKHGTLPDFKSLGYNDLLSLLTSMKDNVYLARSTIKYIENMSTKKNQKTNVKSAVEKELSNGNDNKHNFLKSELNLRMSQLKLGQSEPPSSESQKLDQNNKETFHRKNTDLFSEKYSSNNETKVNARTNLSLADMMDRNIEIIRPMSTTKNNNTSSQNVYENKDSKSTTSILSNDKICNKKFNSSKNDNLTKPENGNLVYNDFSKIDLIDLSNPNNENNTFSTVDHYAGVEKCFGDLGVNLLGNIPAHLDSTRNNESVYDLLPGTSEIYNPTSTYNKLRETTNQNASIKPQEATNSGVVRKHYIKPAIPNHIPSDIIENLFKLVKKYDNGIEIDNILPAYKQEYCRTLHVGSYGYSSLLEMLAEIPKIFKLTFFKNSCIVETVNLIKHMNFSDANVKPALCKRIKCVLLQYPGGLSIKQFSFLYVKEYPSLAADMEWKRAGYLSLLDFLKHCGSDTVGIIDSSNPPIIYHPDHYNALKFYFDKPKTDKFSHVALGTKYQEINIAEMIKTNNPLDVRVASVVSPINIYVILDGQQYYDALEDLMNKMQVFYCNPSHSSQYKLSSVYCVLDQPVVTIYEEDNNFYRGLIVGFKELTIVEVLCVDYGTIIDVPNDRLYHLEQDLFALPIQALQMKLWGIKSKSKTGWVRGASQRLIKLVSDKVLQAKVKEIYDGVLSVKLYDNSGEKKVLINQVLVNEQFVEVKEQKINFIEDEDDEDKHNVSVFTVDQLMEIKHNSNVNSQQEEWMGDTVQKQSQQSKSQDYFQEIEENLKQQRNAVLMAMVHNPDNPALFDQLKQIKEQLEQLNDLCSQRGT